MYPDVDTFLKDPETDLDTFKLNENVSGRKFWSVEVLNMWLLLDADSLVCLLLTLRVLVTTIDALGHFETG